MSGIDYFAWLVLIVIVIAVVVVFVVLAMLPGKIAKKRGHPQADAINVAGWLGLLLTLGAVWALAMVWAFMKPLAQPGADGSATAEVEALKARVTNLEARLEAQLEATEGVSP